jgi:hypothetical protein
MSQTFSAVVQKLVDSISILKGPILVTLSVLGFLYFRHTNPFGVFTVLGRSSDTLAVLFLLWLLSGVLCLFGVGGWVIGQLKSFAKRRAEHKRLYEKLQHHLTPEQKSILAQLLLPKHDRHYFTRNDFVMDLVQSGIVDQKDLPLAGLRDIPGHNYTARYLCVLSPVARAYLEKHSYLLPKVEIEDGTYVIKRKDANPYMLGPVEDRYGVEYNTPLQKQKKFIFF